MSSSNGRVRILYVVGQWPGEPSYGAQQRALHVGCLLRRVGDVGLVVVNGRPDGDRWRVATEAEFTIERVVEAGPAAGGGAMRRVAGAAASAWRGMGPMRVRASDREAVLALRRRYDVAWVFQIRPADLLGIRQWPNTVLDIDDLPSRLHRSLAGVARSLWGQTLSQGTSIVWRRRERCLHERFPVLLVTNEDDRGYLGVDGVRVLPNGFERPPVVERRPVEPARLGFVGGFWWLPNFEGMRWFCHSVWPRIVREIPAARLRVVGDGTEAAAGWAAGIDGIGRLPDTSREMSSWSAMIVPVRAGSGTRIKVLEAFARRCPVVATTMGAFGYGVKDGEELFVADEPAAFAARCLELMRSPRRAAAMAERAHREFLARWTWDAQEHIVRAAIAAASAEAR